jgi:hypothetical protein
LTFGTQRWRSWRDDRGQLSANLFRQTFPSLFSKTFLLLLLQAPASIPPSSLSLPKPHSAGVDFSGDKSIEEVEIQ